MPSDGWFITWSLSHSVLEPPPGTFTAATQVTLACATTGATIRYTTDGSTPTATSIAYTGAITVNATSKVTAIAFLTNWTPSDPVIGYYIISIPQKVATPAFTVAPGTFTTSIQVGITCATAGTVIRYTIDGTAPTANSTLYTGPITVTKTTVITAKAFKSGSYESDALTGTFTIVAPTPTQGVDLMIKTSTIGNLIGEGIIDTQGTQLATKSTASQRIASYIIVLKNTGNSVDYFTVTATGKKLGWHVNFADPAGRDITSMVTSSYGWMIPTVPAGGIVSFRLDVTPVSGTAINDSLDVIITATSKIDATKADQVKATTIKVK